MGTVVSLVVGLLLVGGTLTLFERWRPAIAGRRWWRRDAGTDLAYWFFTPLVTKAITRGVLVAAIVLVVWAAEGVVTRERIDVFLAGRGVVARWPRALQIAAVLVLGDLLGYATHRAFHRGRLWPFHAVHHSSPDVDWLSSVRLHPVNDLVMRVAQSVPLLLLGFPATVLAGYVPFLTLYAVFLHANVPWDFGPLRLVLASPAFHRWHHTSETEGLDRNFAGLFPAIDLAFGTLHMPRDLRPERFGIVGTTVPDGIVAQLAYPWRMRGR